MPPPEAYGIQQAFLFFVEFYGGVEEQMSTKNLISTDSKANNLIGLSQVLDEQIERVYEQRDESLALLREACIEPLAEELMETELRRKSQLIVDGLQAIRDGIINLEISNQDASEFLAFLKKLAEKIWRYLVN